MAAVFLTNVLLIWQGWVVAQHALVTSAQDTTVTMGRLVDEKAHNLVTSALTAMRQLTRDPIAGARDMPARLTRLEHFADTLELLPNVSSVFIGYRTGEFALLRPLPAGADANASFDPPAGAAFLLQSITRDDTGRMIGEWRFFDADLRILQTRPVADYDFDPRTRPWYRTAAENPGMHLSAPYVFFTTRQVGVTLSQKASFGDAVIGLDLELSSLGAQLKALRPTPRTEIALRTSDGTAVAYTDLARLIYERNGELKLHSAEDLGAPALTALATSGIAPYRSTTLRADHEQWFGIEIPITPIDAHALELLVAIPDADLFAELRAGLEQQALGAAAFTVLTMALGWFLGRRVGNGLTKLSTRAQRLSRFDFSLPGSQTSPIREVRELEGVLGEACATIQSFLDTLDTIGSEPRLDLMLGKVLQQTAAATGCSFGAVYLLDKAEERLQLTALTQSHEPGRTIQFPDVELPLSAIAPGHPPIGALAPGDAQLALPLLDRQQKLLGLLRLDYPVDLSHGGDEFRAFVGKLSGALAAAIETRRLMEAQEDLLDGFVLLVAHAIDAKSPYTGGHCQRVPALATLIVDHMSHDREGPYAAYRLDEAQRYEFYLGAWLHDCGKVTSPEHIIDKATKLEAVHNRIHEVRTRFELLWRDAEIAHLRRLLAGAEPDASQARMDEEQAALHADFAFIAQCNIGAEFMTDAAIARIREIAGRRWQRHFSDRLGLSRAETERLAEAFEPALPAEELLLADRPEHKLPWDIHRPPVEKTDPANVYGFDMTLPAHAEDRGEIHNLCIRRGTLTDEERFRVNDHIVQTYIMLHALPWPAHLRRVPQIAATHHERMDGKGYPRHLRAADLTLEDRVMALADIFEALTAADRPYKPAKTLGESLRIMVSMCREGHLDPELMRYFLENRLWAAYAADFLKPEQRDAVDLRALLAQLPAPACVASSA